jgi:hypothetical protein
MQASRGFAACGVDKILPLGYAEAAGPKTRAKIILQGESTMSNGKGNDVAMVRLVFEIPLNEITVSADGEFYNIPYYLEGKLGKKKAILKGKRIVLPVTARETVKKEETVVKLTKTQMAGLV